MTKTIIILWFVAVCSSGQTITPKYATEHEKRMLDAWKQNEPLPYSLIQSILIAEGSKDPSEIASAEAKLDVMLRDVDASVRRRKAPRDRARVLFENLHEKFFKKYHSYALMSGIFEQGFYSTVTAAAVFGDACRRFQIPVTIHATTAHIYFCLAEGMDTIRIEIADRNGFDSKADRASLTGILRTYHAKTLPYISTADETKYFREYILNRESGPYALIAHRYYLDGNAYIESGETENAVTSSEKAMMMQPENPLFQALHASTFFSFATLAKTDKERYYMILERYLLIHRNDADFVEMNATALDNYCIYLRDRREYLRCIQLLTVLGSGIDDDADTRGMIADQVIKTHYYWAYNHFETGDYQQAFEKMKEVLHQDSTAQRYIETSLKFAARYSTWLIEKGKSKQAFVILDSIIVRYFTYPFIKETYVKSCMNLVHGENLMRDDPARATEILLNAYRYDAENKPLTNLIAGAFHNYAKQKMKVMNYKVAREIVMKGLRYSPNDTYLKADLKYLDGGKK
jgi:tetratricopeptide (TPR) repeat protein